MSTPSPERPERGISVELDSEKRLVIRGLTWENIEAVALQYDHEYHLFGCRVCGEEWKPANKQKHSSKCWVGSALAALEGETK